MRQAILPFAIWFGLTGPAWAQPQMFYEHYKAGRAQVDQGQFGAAVTSFKSALADVPNGPVPDANIYVALGYAQMRLGHLDEAGRSFNNAERELSRLTPTSRQQLQANRDIIKKLRQ